MFEIVKHRILGVLSLLVLVSFGIFLINMAESGLEEAKKGEEIRMLFSAKGGKVLVGATAVLLWVYFIDPFVMAWFRVRDIFDRRGKWADTDPLERAAWALGWFLAFSAWIVGFMWGGSV